MIKISIEYFLIYVFLGVICNEYLISTDFVLGFVLSFGNGEVCRISFDFIRINDRCV